MSDAPAVTPTPTWGEVFPWFREVMAEDDAWYVGQVDNKTDIGTARLADAAVTRLKSLPVGRLFPAVRRVERLDELSWPKHRLLNALHRGGCFTGDDLSYMVIAEMLSWESVGPIIVKQILEVVALEEIRASSAK
jgi:hypothetical protein